MTDKGEGGRKSVIRTAQSPTKSQWRKRPHVCSEESASYGVRGECLLRCGYLPSKCALSCPRTEPLIPYCVRRMGTGTNTRRWFCTQLKAQGPSRTCYEREMEEEEDKEGCVAPAPLPPRVPPFIHVYLSIYLYLSLSLSLSIYIYIYICMHIYIYLYIYICIPYLPAPPQVVTSNFGL